MSNQQGLRNPLEEKDAEIERLQSALSSLVKVIDSNMPRHLEVFHSTLLNAKRALDGKKRCHCCDELFEPEEGEQCSFSFAKAVTVPLQDRMTYAAQCPICGAIRTSTPRKGFHGNGYRVFPSHQPLDGTARDRACWKRDASGVWHWHWWMPPQDAKLTIDDLTTNDRRAVEVYREELQLKVDAKREEKR